MFDFLRMWSVRCGEWKSVRLFRSVNFGALVTAADSVAAGVNSKVGVTFADQLTPVLGEGFCERNLLQALICNDMTFLRPRIQPLCLPQK